MIPFALNLHTQQTSGHPLRTRHHDGPKRCIPNSERGSSTIEFLSAFSFGILMSGLIVWITWFMCLRVHVENIAARAASMVSHDTLLTHHQNRQLEVKFIKSWSKATLELFPFINALHSQGMDSRMRILSGSHLGEGGHFSIHLCIPDRSMISISPHKPTQKSDSRDCLGQWSEFDQLTSSWMRVDSRHLAHSSHSIYRNGLTGISDAPLREDMNSRVLRIVGDLQWD